MIILYSHPWLFTLTFTSSWYPFSKVSGLQNRFDPKLRFPILIIHTYTIAFDEQR
jgi:hypothetical protein